MGLAFSTSRHSLDASVFPRDGGASLSLLPMISIVGPTAVGKTQLAVALARRFGCEIISADSRQVYRHMDIGTAKPTAAERKQAPHHLIDVVDLDQDFGLGLFLRLAREQVRDCRARGVLPIVAGGTGQYVWALLEGWEVPEIPPDREFRAVREKEAAERGPEGLYAELCRLDPVRAAQLDYRNVRRVIRALEIAHWRQGPVPAGNRTDETTGEPLVIGLTMERQKLYRRIDQRVDRMMETGFLEEVAALLAQGYEPGPGPLDSPGYRELGLHLAGQLPLDEALQRTKYRTHRLARSQYTWFKLGDPRIQWLDASAENLEERASAMVENALAGRPLC